MIIEELLVCLFDFLVVINTNTVVWDEAGTNSGLRFFFPLLRHIPFHCYLQISLYAVLPSQTSVSLFCYTRNEEITDILKELIRV